MFFEDNHGRYHHVSQVRRLRPRSSSTGKPWDWTHSAVLMDGEDVEVTAREAKRILRAGVPTIPAQPGTYLLQFYDDKHGTPPTPTVWRLPVLAFLTSDETGTPLPIVMDGEIGDMETTHAILHPCGLVEDFCGAQFQAEADWRAEMERCAALDRAREEGGQA